MIPGDLHPFMGWTQDTLIAKWSTIHLVQVLLWLMIRVRSLNRQGTAVKMLDIAFLRC